MYSFDVLLLVGGISLVVGMVMGYIANEWREDD